LISVAECICRKEQHFLGKECDRPKETCLGFGQFARFYIDNQCGLCVGTCPEEAISLLEKPGMEVPPLDVNETLKKIGAERKALQNRS